MITPIYHYTKIESGLNILFDKKIRLNKVGKTNDPRESKPWELPTFLLTFDSQDNPDKDAINDANNLIRDDAQKVIKDEWLVACFTLDAKNYGPRDNDDKIMYDAFLNPGYARPRMWAQYAENHKGICLLLDKNLLEENLQQKFKERYFSGPVNYDLTSLLSSSFIFPNKKEILDGIKQYGRMVAARKYVKDYCVSSLFIKNPDWATEAEYRYLVYSEKSEFEDVSIEGVVKEVIVGIDFPKIYEPSLITYCKELGVQPKRMKWHNGASHPIENFEIISNKS